MSTTTTPPKRLEDHPLFHELLKLPLPRDDFVVFGSGLLLARGLRDIDDFDLVARGEAWQQAQKIGTKTVGTLSGDDVYELVNGRIQISRHWFWPSFKGDEALRVENTDQLINRAPKINGVKFALSADVLAYKSELRRSNDLADIELLHGYE